MEILRWLDDAPWINYYAVQDFRQWVGGFYYRLTIHFEDQSVLFVKEYVDQKERVYSFHWQDKYNKMIIRWDNAPHHRHILTYPHHKHTSEGIIENSEIALLDVLEEIRDQIATYSK